MSKQKYVIWTNELDYDDWKEDLEAEYPDMTERQRVDTMYEINNDDLYNERCNLNIKLNRDILVIADLGLWMGRRVGYKELPSNNIRDCLYDEGDYITWYVDGLGDLCCDSTHHDGTNHLMYRTYKDSATDEQIENLKWKLYCGKATRKDITRITKRLGDEIAAVYGWKIRKAPERKKKVPNNMFVLKVERPVLEHEPMPFAAKGERRELKSNG